MKAKVIVVVALGMFVWVAASLAQKSPLDKIGVEYVRLVLELGQHDAGYVDAYYGPEELRLEDDAEKKPVAEIEAAGNALITQLEKVDVSSAEKIVQLRKRYLATQIMSLVSYSQILGGKQMTFDEESLALYDAVAPNYGSEYFQSAIKKLDGALPGKGTVSERLEAFRDEFTIPIDKLDVVFTAAIEECRRRTLLHLELPEGERFEIEYVTDKPWSAYNWYKGDSYSLIQVNTQLPIRISRAIDLACHEGYPGHHVYNALLEHHLVNKRGWVEFSVYALFSPQSLIAEGSANFGIEVAFPADERVEFEKEVLFPLAGIDPEKAELYYEIEELMDALSYAGNEAARQYLDGELDARAAEDWLVKHALSSRERAQQRVRFFDVYRTYVINYNLGQDLVRDYVNARGGTSDNPAQRWAVFNDLLSSPRLPSDLRSTMP